MKNATIYDVVHEIRIKKIFDFDKELYFNFTKKLGALLNELPKDLKEECTKIYIDNHKEFKSGIAEMKKWLKETGDL